MPMKNPPHPGDLIKTEIIEALGLTVSKAAEILKVRRATLSDLLHGKAALTPEMALRIEKARARARHIDQTVCPGLRFDSRSRRQSPRRSPDKYPSIPASHMSTQIKRCRSKKTTYHSTIVALTRGDAVNFHQRWPVFTGRPRTPI